MKTEVIYARFLYFLLITMAPLICEAQNECFDANGDCTLATPVEFQVQLMAECGDTLILQSTQELCNTWSVPTGSNFENGVGADSMDIHLVIDQCFTETIIVDGITNTPSGSGVASCNTSIIYTITPILDTVQQTLNCREFSELGSQTEWLQSSCGCDSIFVEYVLLEMIDTSYLLANSCDPNDVGVQMVTLESIATGCDSIVITTTELTISQEIILDVAEACIGETMILDALLDGAINYVWDTGETTAFIEVTETGDYTVTVTDVNGCEIVATAEAYFNDIDIDLTVSVSDPFLLETVPLLEVWQGAAIELEATINGTSLPYEIIWNGGPEVGDTILNFTAQESGELKVAVIDSLGCFAIETTEVIVRPIAAFVPSGFSPNGDLNNDMLNVFTSPNMEEVRLQVFARNGGLVFDKVLSPEQDGEGLVWQGWDGNLDGKPLHPQVLAFQLWFRGIRGEWRSIAGDVTLVR